MTSHTWPEEFDKLLRTYLPLLDDDGPLTPASALPDLGLDSLATVGLLVDVEESCGVAFPDEMLTADTFATAGALWSAVQLLQDRSGS